MRVTVELAAPVGVVFAYLADPSTRPEWQSSLRRVDLIGSGEPRVGTEWYDVTAVGVRPRLRISRMRTDELWAEEGWWRGLRADLTLRFSPVPGGTRVDADISFEGAGPWSVLARLAGLFAPLAAKGDLQRAGRILSERGHRQ